MKPNGRAPAADQLADAEARLEELFAAYRRDAEAVVRATVARTASSEACDAQRRIVDQLRARAAHEAMEAATPADLRAELEDTRAAIEIVRAERHQLFLDHARARRERDEALHRSDPEEAERLSVQGMELARRIGSFDGTRLAPLQTELERLEGLQRRPPVAAVPPSEPVGRRTVREVLAAAGKRLAGPS